MSGSSTFSLPATETARHDCPLNSHNPDQSAPGLSNLSTWADDLAERSKFIWSPLASFLPNSPYPIAASRTGAVAAATHRSTKRDTDRSPFRSASTWRIEP